MMTTVPVMTPSSRAPILGTVCGWAPREPPFINAKPKPEGASRGLRIQAKDQEGAGGRLQNGGVGSRRISHETASGHACAGSVPVLVGGSRGAGLDAAPGQAPVSSRSHTLEGRVPLASCGKSLTSVAEALSKSYLVFA